MGTLFLFLSFSEVMMRRRRCPRFVTWAAEEERRIFGGGNDEEENEPKNERTADVTSSIELLGSILACRPSREYHKCVHF